MEDDPKAWPPAPNTPNPSPGRASHTPHLVPILVMWAVTIGQAILQTVGLILLARPCGFIGFVLAVYLVSRRERAAEINGGLRLLLAVLGLFYHMISTR